MALKMKEPDRQMGNICYMVRSKIASLTLRKLFLMIRVEVVNACTA